MRAYVMDRVALVSGLQIIERAISPNVIASMDEAFLTNALMEIMPLISIDGQLIGAEVPEKYTRAMQELLKEV